MRPDEPEDAGVIPPPRTLEQRTRDTLGRLETDVDAWVATADAGSGTPYLVPLSFLWDGTALLIATPVSSPTARNLRSTGRVRLGVGPTRDVVLIEGTVHPLTASDITDELADAFASKAGFDPRELRSPYLYVRIEPRRIQAWREENELADREVMRDGRWLVP